MKEKGYWTTLDSERRVFRNETGDIAFVCETPFGWVVAWRDHADGLYKTREAAMKAAEEEA